jgi:EAL domain-containing protein (putative c-di-GMP-specific phosphodiesterase class I)
VERFLQASVLPPLASPVVGVAPFRLGEVTGEHLLRTAHSAAQDARNSGLRVSIYSEAADDRHQRRFRLLSDVPHALAADDQFSLAFQPRVDLGSGVCVGVEALLRWRHPVLGNVPPAEFIPMVEQTDLARPLTAWVIETAIQQSLAWRDQGIAVPISINVSAANLEEQAFADRLIQRLKDVGLPCRSIEVEVTESALIRDGTRVGQHLEVLRKSGIKVAIDDFGTGYSSLSYLQTLPADVIKIDQSFIRGLKGNDRGRLLVRSMISMAKSLDFQVVAEGVEDQESFEFLRSCGCDEAQGYLISRPVTPPALLEWMSQA